MNDIVTLDQVFQKRVFCVPDYQRGYAWEARQLDDLLEDLEEMRDGKDHYTGTLVLHRASRLTPPRAGITRRAAGASRSVVEPSAVRASARA